MRTIRFCSVVFGVTSSLAVIHTIHSRPWLCIVRNRAWSVSCCRTTATVTGYRVWRLVVEYPHTGCVFRSGLRSSWLHSPFAVSTARHQPILPRLLTVSLISTHGGGCARGRRRRFSCRQLVAALLATAPFLSQLRAHGTVCRSLWHLRRHYWRSGGSWRQRCSTATTSDSSLTAICFCFLLDTVTCPCSFIY